MIKWNHVITSIIAFIIVMVISFLVTAGLIKVLSLCFGFVFSWKLALGIWVLFILIKWLLPSANKN